MRNGRAIASIVVLTVLVGLLGACGGGTSKSINSNVSAQAAAARASVAAARQRIAAAQLQVARQRRALAAALRRRQQERSTTTTTTSTTVPTVVATSTSTTVGPVGSETPSVASDTAAVQRTIDAVNAAFAKSVAMGITASETANYYISVGVYTASQCSTFEAARGLGQVADRLVLHPGSVVATPGWVDPVLGAVPGGRIYSLAMDDIETQLSSGQERTASVTTHATVLPDGQALLFLRCS
jgi:hypothetical protein